MKKLIPVGLVVLILLLTNCHKSDMDPSPAFPGQKVDVGGYRLHYILHTQPNKSLPTVVMDAGLGGFSLDFYPVQEALKNYVTTLSYDRGGMAWSELIPQPGLLEQHVEELHALINKLGLQKPLLLMGHSNGALRMMAYARRYPDEVYGLVLVDPTVISTLEKANQYLTAEEQGAILQSGGLPGDRSPSAEDLETMKKEIALLDKQGKLKETMKQQEQGRMVRDFLPGRLANLYEEASYSAQSLYSFIDELAKVERNMNTVYGAPITLGNKPLIVLSSTRVQSFVAYPPPGNTSEEAVQALLKLKNMTQQELLPYSTHPLTRQVIVENAGHYLQIDQPQEVVEAVKPILP